MNTRTKIVLAAALICTSAGAALASNENEDKGGFVMPGSTVGVNPVYHPTEFLGYTAGGGAQAYGFYMPAPKAPHRARTQDR